MTNNGACAKIAAMRRFAYLLAFLGAWGALSAAALTVEGRELRLAEGALVAADAEWLKARAHGLLDNYEYGRANDLATLLATLAPADMKLGAQAFAARTKYFAVGHKESYIAFRDLYKGEVARRGDPPAAATKEDLERLGIISKEIAATLSTTYRAAAVSGTRRISTYDSPTANTGVAEPQITTADLRWSVNLLFLIRDYDRANLESAKTALKGILDEPRTYVAVYRDYSMPKSTAARALDEVRGSAGTRARKMLPGAFAREIDRTYNLDGFKFCLKRPIEISELMSYAGRAMKMAPEPEVKVEQYNDEGYVAFRGVATCKATLAASLTDILNYYGCEPYIWRPFVGDLEKKEESKKEILPEPPPDAGGAEGGIPEGP